jgi:cytoskeletal protein CcmA (bactofilin family)
MGMGGMGSGSPAGQGGGQTSFSAKAMDTENNSVQITSATIDGRTVFQAFMGKGKITIPFEQISRVEIKGKSACVTMKNAEKICNLRIKEMAKLEGKTSYGTYQIPMAEVVWVEITRSVQ